MPLEDNPQHLAVGVSRREVWSWAMFDFANSGYTTVVITAIFNAYFVAVVASNEEWGTFAWTAALAVSYALIILTAPALGAYADAYAAKKRLLFLTTIGCIVFTAMLSFVGPGDLWLAVILIILANFFFGSGENLIAAFLPEIARSNALGKVSGWGWSLGYIGGLVSLGCSLAYVTWAQEQGKQADQFVPVTMLITAALFAVSSIPTFLYLKERAMPQQHLTGRSVVREAFARWETRSTMCAITAIWGDFLHALCFIRQESRGNYAGGDLCSAGNGLYMSDTMLLILVVNITAAAGAFCVWGVCRIGWGHIFTIALTLVGWITTVLVAWMADSRAIFWLAANIAGLCLAPLSQRGGPGRILQSRLPDLPEFFGLWGLAVKLSSILGPVTYGLVSWISPAHHRLANANHWYLLYHRTDVTLSVDIQRGRRAALQGESISGK